MNRKPYTLLIKLTVLGYFALTLLWSSMIHAAVYERFAGMVTDNQGKPLVSATVSVNGVSKLTDTKGLFEVYAVRANRYVINTTKLGYMFNSVIEPKSIGGNASLKFVLSPALVITIDPKVENIISDSTDGSGTQIKLPANALVKEQGGQVATQPIFVSLYTYNLAAEAMPGDFSAINQQGTQVALETAGAFWAEFRDATGAKYNLGSGTQATISIPATVGNSQQTIGLWSYDEQTGFWKEEGNASLVNNRFQGTVKHFSVKNFDWQNTNPSCVRLEIDQKLINAYSLNGYVSVKAEVIPSYGSYSSSVIRTMDLNAGLHALYNLPNYATVKLFIPATSTTPYTVINSGAPWGGVGIPNYPYSACQGSFTTNPSPTKVFLSVSPNGGGKVTSLPTGINCGGSTYTCMAAYTLNTVVKLTAIADANSDFAGWSGSCLGLVSQNIDVKMTTGKYCVASFLPKKVTLSVTKTGNGTVTSIPAGINCGVDCTEIYTRNTNVQLTATAGANSVFLGWSGACSGTNPVITVPMTATKSCIANFRAIKGSANELITIPISPILK